MRSLREITAVILAGGLGTRLRPVLPDRPKGLADVDGRPFLAYLLDQLAAVGVRHAVLCTGHLGEQIRAVFGQSYGPMGLVYSQESQPLGTGGALRLALPFYLSDPVLVMNGDTFCQVKLRPFWLWHQVRGARGSLLLIKGKDPGSYGRVEVDEDGRILAFEEKGSSRGPGWINAGVYLLHREIILSISPGEKVSLEREVFPRWLGGGLYGYCSKGKCWDIGTPESFAAAKEFFGRRRS